MSADVRVRRLIVTLPEVSGEEADAAAENIRADMYDKDRGPVYVTHALGESLPDDVAVRTNRAWAHLVLLEHQGHRVDLAPDEARAIAGALLHAADAADLAVSV